MYSFLDKLSVQPFHILVLNKELVQLAKYKISIVEPLITSVNKHLHYIKHRMADLYGCFDDEKPPLSYTGFDDLQFSVFEIVPVRFSYYETKSLRVRSNSAIPDASRQRAKSD